MTLAKGRTRQGVDINEDVLETLREACTRSETEEIENTLSGRTERRVTYFLDGLDVCTVIREGDKVVEIQKGLFDHPIIDRLVM